MLQQIAYLLTVYFPLRIRDLSVNALVLLLKEEHAVELSHRLLRRKRLVGILPDGNLLCFPLDDLKLLTIISEIYDRKIYDSEDTDNHDLICDVGAHIGLFSLRMARKAKNGRIIAIEASPSNYRFCLRNIRLNNLNGRIEAINAAVGERKSRATLWLSNVSGGDNSLVKGWHYSGPLGRTRMRQEVSVQPLDDILPEATSRALVKIDVEGMELGVLAGLAEKSAKVSRLIIEVHTSVTEEAKVYDWLRDHDFSITKKHRLYGDCLLVEARRHYG